MKRAALEPPAPRRRTASPLPLVLALLAAVPAAPAGAVHPFYAEQLRLGSLALERGDHAAATEALRLASFGLLDEPPALAGCLARLALARQAEGDAAGARELIDRVLALEERFGAYRAAELPETVTVPFADLVARVVPAERLAALDAFREVARRQIEQELAALPVDARRSRLEELLAAEPDEPRWALLLGRLEMAAERYPRAGALADRVLAARPASQDGLCLRGLSRAGAGDCAGAVEDLAACEQSRIDVAVTITFLSCLEQLERWSEAVAFAAGLPAGLRGQRPVARLERRAARKAPAPQPTTTVAAPSDAAVGPGTPPETGPSAGGPGGEAGAPRVAGGGATGEADGAEPAPLGDDDRSRLERARTLLGSARTSGELSQAWALAREVADRNPDAADAQHLAAEIAYRSSRWSDAVGYYQRGGEPERPEQLFYLAVSLYESGAAGEAAAVLEKALPRLRRTPFVTGYAERILGSRPPDG